jgi:hypothetical protein
LAITGGRPYACFNEFKKHLTSLLAKTISPTAHPVLVGGEKDELAFLEVRYGAEETIRLDTRLGPMRLDLRQELLAHREKRSKPYRLKTIRYWYHLYPSDSDEGEPLIRWEYESPRALPEARHCLNHVHLDHQLACGTGTLDLVRCHLPTAWVTIESVLRFVIHELDVQPATDTWHEELLASEQEFRWNFTKD